ncbi:MAG: hypothetical protein QOK29_1157 [Rhodospirillaceae bacterium]|nr:hypothetical protein [Rhodospirillaceae bacterium]
MLTLAITLIAVSVAAMMLSAYARESAGLWRGVQHDRNGHFLYGLDLALALRSLDPLGFLGQLWRATVWPPVHGIVLSIVLVLGGIDHRLAIVPSLAGWVATIVLSWLIARRLFRDPIAGITSGLVAVIFAMASPALRLIGSDVMLESLGAALTAFAVYAYMRCAAAPEASRWWRILALTLTILFFEKSNYWLLTIIPLALAYLVEAPRPWPHWLRSIAIADVRRAVRRIAREPLVIAFTLTAAAVVWIKLRGPTSVEILGRDISFYPPGNLTTLAYVFLFARTVRSWRRNRAVVDSRLGVAGRAIFYWHLVPLAISFLLPQRLATFLWYVSNGAASTHYNPVAAVLSQWQGFANGFHVAPWAALLALGLGVIGALRTPRLAPGARAVAILAALSAAAVLLHPHQQWRFQTTWLFAVWVCAGAGAATILAWLTSKLSLRLRIAVPIALLALLVGGQAAQAPSPMAYTVAIRPTSGPSDLDLAAAYLPFTSGVSRIGFVATFGRTGFFAWTMREHCRCRTATEEPWFDFVQSRDDARRIMANWIATTRAQRIVVVDAPGWYEIPILGFTHDRMVGALDAMAGQDRFVRVQTIPVPSFPAEVSIWRLRDASEVPP